jgi:hypothetical protein
VERRWCVVRWGWRAHRVAKEAAIAVRPQLQCPRPRVNLASARAGRRTVSATGMRTTWSSARLPAMATVTGVVRP